MYLCASVKPMSLTQRNKGNNMLFLYFCGIMCIQCFDYDVMSMGYSNNGFQCYIIQYLPYSAMGRVKRCKAKFHRYYVEDENGKGQCEQCDHCSPGYGWNFTEINENPPGKNERGDDLGCYTCHPCTEGYYRLFDSAQWSCSICRRNCAHYNRYVGEPCGGHTRGFCGSCLPGFYDPTRNIQQFCIPEVQEITTIGLGMKTSKATTQGNELTDATYTNGNRPPQHSAENGYIGGGIATSVLGVGIGSAVVFCVLFVAFLSYCAYRHFRNPRNSTYDDSLKVNISSIATDIGQSNVKIDSTSEESSSLLEMDMDPHPEVPDMSLYAEKPHPELRDLPSQNGPECLNRGHPPYRSFKLHKDDAYLTITAKHIYSERVGEFFRNIGVHSQIVYANKNLYEIGKCTYADYILNVLIEWVKQDTATFDVLCKELDKADFQKVSLILQQVNSDNSANSAAGVHTFGRDP